MNKRKIGRKVGGEERAEKYEEDWAEKGVMVVEGEEEGRDAFTDSTQ